MTIKTVHRYDVNALTIGKNVRETAQGFLEIDAITARTGIQSYRLSDGRILREFRPESEVFSDEAMTSMRTAVVTDGHPKVFVNPDNAKELMVGFNNGVIEKVAIDGEFFPKTKLIITHKKGIDAIRAGKVQLSHGYRVDLEMKDGEHRGNKFDAIQRNISNNHIALVWAARAGAKASLQLDSENFHMDSDDGILVMDNHFFPQELKNGHFHSDPLGGDVSVEYIDTEFNKDGFHNHKRPNGDFTSWDKNTADHLHNTNHGNTGIPVKKINNDNKENDKMKLKIGEKEFEVSDEVGTAVKDEMTKMEAAKTAAEAKADKNKEKADKAEDLETENEVLKASKSKLIAKADSLQSDLDKKVTPKLDGENLDKAVKERMEVVDAGRQMLSKEEVEKIDEMKNEDIKKAVIKADSPKVDEEKLKDESYVNARFDHIVENLQVSDSKKRKLGKKIVEGREENADEEYMSPDEVRKASMENAKEDSLKPAGKEESEK